MSQYFNIPNIPIFQYPNIPNIIFTLFLTYYAAATVCLTLFYVSCIILYAKCWKNLPFFENTEGVLPTTFISVLIPARNEADNILACIDTILSGNYPKNLFEIIVIDDHSDDATPQLVAAHPNSNVRLIELKNYVKLADNQPFKKRAIEAAIGASKGDLIVTTDGDCIAPPEWLSLIAAFYEQSGKRFIAAPVNFYDEKTDFERFQSLDYIGMMGVTGAGVQGRFTNMCNGANLAYEKTLFHEVGGFQGIDHVASGDDMLLMQKIARFHPHALGFLKNPKATVLTKAKPTIADFMSQRLRWASKSSSYTEVFTVLQLVMVFCFCWNILLSFCATLFFGLPMFGLFLFQFIAKSVADYFFLRTMARFFSREDLMHPFLPPQYLHVLYIIVVGSLANFKKTYQWKGRTVK